MGLNIHSEEPFNQKVEYNVRTECEIKKYIFKTPWDRPFLRWLVLVRAKVQFDSSERKVKSTVEERLEFRAN